MCPLVGLPFPAPRDPLGKENRTAVFRTRSGFSPLTDKGKPRASCAGLSFGVSAGARTRTEGVGGLYGIQFHYGHMIKSLRLSAFPKKDKNSSFGKMRIYILPFFASFLQAFML